MALIQKNDEPDSEYTDLKEEWYKAYVKQWEYLGIFSPDTQGYLFTPNEWIDRNSAVEFLFKVIRLYR
jgi:hypothetical protein